MTGTVTVYFDTSFYVWLARAPDAEATTAIGALNALRVRHVLSDLVMQELLSGRSREVRDRILFVRLARLAEPPYRLLPHLTWEILLANGPERNALEEVLRAAADLTTVANSHSQVARRGMTQEQQAAWNTANAEFLSTIGFDPASGSFDLARLAGGFRPLFKAFGLTLPDEPTRDDLQTAAEAMRARLGPDVLQTIEQQHRLHDSVTALEARPFQIATGRSEFAKRLGGTFRDAEHMARFVEHAAAIDFLQVDGPQERLIRRDAPVHELRRLGLADRCFSATSLGEAITKMRGLLNARSDQRP